jgi:2',3'-cyclic-nucleotide 2'-phosphodiesterase (5'-nucleotidase family)
MPIDTAPPFGAADGEVKPSPSSLRIVAINDVYALDSLPRLATLVRQARDGADRVLVTLAGDFLAPSVLSSLDSGRGMVAVLNAIGVTHVTFGNHEDDIPRAALVARMKELSAVWLSTNVHGFERPLPETDIVDVAGVKIGLCGVVLIDPLIYRRPPFGAQLEAPQAATLRATAQLIGEQRCAWVVALTHQSADDDRLLARALHGKPAIILGGHEHVPLDEDIDGIRILKAGVDATHALIVDASFPPGGGPPEVSARRVPCADYAEAPDVRELVDKQLAPVRALGTATLVELTPDAPLSSVGMRARATSVGALVCSRLRDVLQADACIFNAGGIRAARDYAERFTYGDLEAELPFDNEVVVIKIPGAVLRESIVASRAQAPNEHGGFLQVDDGITVDAVSRDVTHAARAPLDPARVYHVATIRDLCFGLDHIDPLVAYVREHPEAVPPAGGFRTPRELLVRAFARSLWEQLGGFDALDANHDGRVSPAEVTSALAHARHHDVPELLGELVVHAFDSDGNDAITAGEVPKK